MTSVEGHTSRDSNSRKQEPADPVERADRRRDSVKDGDVTVERDGTVRQKPHGNMDDTLVPKGREHPEQGPYTPEHDHIDPDLEPDDGSHTRPPQDTPSARTRQRT